MNKYKEHGNSLFNHNLDSIIFSVEKGEEENAIRIQFLTDREDFTLSLNENQFVELYERINSFVKFMNKFN